CRWVRASSSQFSVLSSRFSVLGFRFSVFGSQSRESPNSKFQCQSPGSQNRQTILPVHSWRVTEARELRTDLSHLPMFLQHGKKLTYQFFVPEPGSGFFAHGDG